MRRAGFWLAASALLLLPFMGSAEPAERTGLVDLSALENKEELVLSVGDRLAIAGKNLCALQAPDPGFSLHDLTQYNGPYRDLAKKLFARPDLPEVSAVAADGAAARAGVQAGDAVIGVNGKAVPAETGDGLARVEIVIAEMQAAARTGPVELTLIHNGSQVSRTFTAPIACAVRFQVEPDDVMDASTNGWLIDITTKLIDFTQGPDELAAVLGHEMGHVILNHHQAGKVRRAQSRANELAADRIGVRLASLAGFRPEAAVTFWERMRRQGGFGPTGMGRHPTDRERLKAVADAVIELHQESEKDSEP